jgi:FxsC-like protein
MGVWFFFSYARADRDDRLDRFYQRLCKEVGKAKQLSESEAGFFDQRSIEIGDIWDEKLREGLRTARVLVCMCSPSYFTREYCGKELQACIGRVPKTAESTAIFPIVWDMPQRSQHPALNKYQYTHADLPSIYAREGLYYIMGPGKYADDYEEFVMRLARKIVETGEQRPLLTIGKLPAFDQIANPFAKAPKSAGKTIKHAMFSYVAGRPEELPAELSERYGTDGKEWRPFHPECTDPVGIMAQEVAAKQKLFYKDLPLDGELVKRIREAEDNKEVVIVVVDPWSVQVKSYEQYMRSYDKNNFDNSAVLIAWNSPDGGTDAQRKMLRKHLSDTFKHHAVGRRSIYYVDSINSHHDFRSALAKTISRLRANLIQSSDAHQEIDAPDLARRADRAGIATDKQPIASGPGDAGR